MPPTRIWISNPSFAAGGYYVTYEEGVPVTPGSYFEQKKREAEEEMHVTSRSQEIQGGETATQSRGLQPEVTAEITRAKEFERYGVVQARNFIPNESFGYVKYYDEQGKIHYERGYVQTSDQPKTTPQTTVTDTRVREYEPVNITAKRVPEERPQLPLEGAAPNPQPTPQVPKEYVPEQFGAGYGERAAKAYPNPLVDENRRIDLNPNNPEKLIAYTSRGFILAAAGGLDLLGEAVLRPGKAPISIPANIIGGVAQIPFQLGGGLYDIGRGDLPAAYTKVSDVVTPLAVFHAVGGTVKLGAKLSPYKYGGFGIEQIKDGQIESKILYRGIYKEQEPYAKLIFGRTETGAFVRGTPTPEQIPSLFDVERLNLPSVTNEFVGEIGKKSPLVSNVQVRPDSTVAAAIISNTKTLEALNVKPEQASKIVNVQTALDVTLKGKNYLWEEPAMKFEQGQVVFKLITPESFKAFIEYAKENKKYFSKIAGSTSSYPFTNPEVKLVPSDLEVYLTEAGAKNKNLITNEVFSKIKAGETPDIKYELRPDKKGNPRIFSITKDSPEGKPSFDFRMDELTRKTEEGIREFGFEPQDSLNFLKFGMNQVRLWGRNRILPAEIVGGMPVLNIKSQLIIMGGQSITLFKMFDAEAGKWRVIFEPPLKRGKDIVKFTEYGVSQTQGKLMSGEITLPEANKALEAFKNLERAEWLNKGTPGIAEPVVKQLADMPKLYSLISDKPVSKVKFKPDGTVGSGIRVKGIDAEGNVGVTLVEKSGKPIKTMEQLEADYMKARDSAAEKGLKQFLESVREGKTSVEALKEAVKVSKELEPEPIKFDLTESILGKKLEPYESSPLEPLGGIKEPSSYPSINIKKDGGQGLSYPKINDYAGSNYPKTKGYPTYAKNTSYPKATTYPTINKYPTTQYPKKSEYPSYPTPVSYPKTTPYPTTPSYPNYPTTPAYPKPVAYPKTPEYPAYPKPVTYPRTPSYPSYPRYPNYPKVPGGPGTPPPKTPPKGKVFSSDYKFGVKGELGYKVLFKKGGVFLEAKTKPLPRQEALALGQQLTKAGAQATFKLRPAGNVVAKQVRRVFAQEEYYTPKSIKPTQAGEEIFTQKPKFRIKTPGEYKEITLKGLQARRRR